MDFHRRRLVAMEDLMTSSTSQVLELRDVATATSTSTSTATSSTYTPNPTIAPFDTGLTGVNQVQNYLFRDALWWTMGIMGFVILAIRILELLWAQLRRIHAMSVPGNRQGYWKVRQWSWMPGMKKSLIYAPLWKKRHNREIQLAKKISVGVLPSRLHFFILLGYVGSNLVYLLILDWANENKWFLCAELRGRSGTLALINMIPLVIFAGRNNPLISLFQISFDTYNLLHRWIGRTVVGMAVVHTLAWAIVQVADGGWSSVWYKALFNTFCASGMAGTLSMVVLLILSFSPIRHAFYETFLNTHIILAFIAFVGTWVHCASPALPGITALPQLPVIICVMILWFFDRLARMIRLAHCNFSGKGRTEAIIEALPGETTRVTMHLPRYIKVNPGSHAYIRFSGLNVWENHPFSIAWVDHSHESQTLPVTAKDVKVVMRPVDTSVSFVIGAQSGMTRKLYNLAKTANGEPMRLSAAFEGPYAGHHSMDSYGHAVLFAGATGITHQISYLKHLIEGYNDETVATRRVTLIWIVRDYEALEWVRPWMDKILRMPNRKDLLHIKLFVTRPKNAAQIMSASNTVQMFPGRPNVPVLLTKEVQEQMGAMCVSVCGPGALADDVRSAVRLVQDEKTVVDFVEESFTW